MPERKSHVGSVRADEADWALWSEAAGYQKLNKWIRRTLTAEARRVIAEREAPRLRRAAEMAAMYPGRQP